jgi:hypothetical protein
VGHRWPLPRLDTGTTQLGQCEGVTQRHGSTVPREVELSGTGMAIDGQASQGHDGAP